MRAFPLLKYVLGLTLRLPSWSLSAQHSYGTILYYVASTLSGLKPEANIKAEAVRYLRKICGDNVRKEFKVIFPSVGKAPELDRIGIESGKIVHIGECKKGGFRQPTQGIGQLLGIRYLIETDFDSFKRRLTLV